MEKHLHLLAPQS